MSNPHFIRREKCPCCSSDSVKSICTHPYSEPPIRDYLEEFYSSKGNVRVEFEYLEDARYSLAECQKCGVIFQQEIPNDSLRKRLYEHWIDPQADFAHHEERDALGGHSHYTQEIRQVIAFLNKPPSSLRVFDFGMGWGKWAATAKAHGCAVYGSDLSDVRREYARSNGIHALDWDEIPQHQFDFVNAEQIFEHIPEPLNTLLHLKTALKPEGILKISVPTANDIKRRLRIMDWTAPKGSRNSLNPVAPLEHINFFRRRSLLTMATLAGMEEVHIPLRIQYRFITCRGGMKTVAKNLLRPIYRNLLKRQNCLFCRKTA